MNQETDANDTPILACLRAEKKTDELHSRTQHTVSTLASSHFEDSIEGLDFDDEISIDFDEEDSLALDDVFDCDPLHAFDENGGKLDYVAMDMALRASGQVEDDEISQLQDSHYEDFEEDMPENSYEPVAFNDSMNSLNEAFEKLNRCMMRTSQTRKMVREFTEKASSNTADEEPKQVLTEGSYDEQEVVSSFPITDDYPPYTASLNSSLQGGLNRGHDSFSSLSSAGSRSSRKGRRTYNKSRRRAHKKGTLSRTGVVLRPSLAALLLS